MVFLELAGREITQGRVPSLSIVIDFDELEHLPPGAVAAGKRARASSVMQDLLFESGEEAFDGRVVMAVAAPTQACNQTLIAQQVLIGMAGVLAALVAVMKQTLGQHRRGQRQLRNNPLFQGHAQRVESQVAGSAARSSTSR